MKKGMLLLLMVVLMLALLTSCGCEHEWAEPDCDSPKTCNLCGETEGAPLGHSWMAATCAKAKTCENCGAVEGEPLAHTWVDATCESAKTCSVCKATEGDPLGHDWQDATCDTAKTCKVCQKVEGEPLGHTYSDEVSCEEAKVCGTCGYSDGVIPGHSWVDATADAPKTCANCGKTEGSALSSVDLGITMTYFQDLMDKSLDIYDVSLEYLMVDEDGNIWYEMVDENGQYTEIYLFYTLAADEKTLSTVTVYTEDATQGQTAYWAGVLGGCSMVIVDPSLTEAELTAMTSEIAFTEDNIDYYVIEKNDIIHIMAVDESTGELFFVISLVEE